jgi:hypothetical protein
MSNGEIVEFEVTPPIEAKPAEPPTEMGMIRLALEKGAPIETIERLVALQEKMLARQGEIAFSAALNRVQDKIKRIAPDLDNKSKNSKYASYAAIDRVIRPIYGPEGFSLSFTHAECPKPDYIRVICWLRLGAHKEPYQVDWPVDTQGPKGGDVMTKTQATGASDSYAKRYLVKDIFNIAIGEDDNDGEVESGFLDFLTLIKEATTLDELKKNYQEAVSDGLKKQSPKAVTAFMDARKKREAELRNGSTGAA